MKDQTEDICTKVREDVIESNIFEKVIKCSWEDFNVVLKGWKQIMANYKEISTEILSFFFIDHPSYKKLFPSLSGVPDDDLKYNKELRIHAYAIVRGINSVMKNLSGEYEGENEILPVISMTHQKRGITLEMMIHLKEAILAVCGKFLKSHKKERAAWNTVIDFIFKDYLLTSSWPSPEVVTESGM